MKLTVANRIYMLNEIVEVNQYIRMKINEDVINQLSFVDENRNKNFFIEITIKEILGRIHTSNSTSIREDWETEHSFDDNQKELFLQLKKVVYDKIDDKILDEKPTLAFLYHVGGMSLEFGNYKEIEEAFGYFPKYEEVEHIEDNDVPF